MTFTDIITHPSKLFHSFSVSEHLDKKDQHKQFERLNESMLNLFPRNRQTNNLEKKNRNEQTQQRNSFLHPSSELSRSISNKSVTFASIFDESQNETMNKDNHVVRKIFSIIQYSIFLIDFRSRSINRK
jgi:hypothetical protein